MSNLTYRWFCRWYLVHVFLQIQLREHLNCSQSSGHSPRGGAAHPVREGRCNTHISSCYHEATLNKSWVSASNDQSCLQRSLAQLTRTGSTDSPLHATAPPPSVSVSPWNALCLCLQGCLKLSTRHLCTGPILWQRCWMPIVVFSARNTQ